MKSRMSASFSICFSFLVVGFLMLFSPLVGQAQTGSTNCEWVWSWEWEWIGDNRERVNVRRCVPTKAQSNSTTPSNASSNSDGLPEIRSSDLIGTWEGLFDKAQYACTLDIEKVEGNTFYGTLKRQGDSVAVTGTIISKAREINFGPTKIVPIDNNRDWRLAFNWGSFSNDGKFISGKGLVDSSTYDWSFTKSNLSASSERSTSQLDKPLKPIEFTKYAEPFLSRGDAKLESKNYQEAIADYEQIIQKCSVSTSTWDKLKKEEVGTTIEVLLIALAKSYCEKANKNQATAKRLLLGNR